MQTFSNTMVRAGDKTGGLVFKFIKPIIWLIVIALVIGFIRNYWYGDEAVQRPEAVAVDDSSLLPEQGAKRLSFADAQKWASDLENLPSSDLLDYSETEDAYAGDSYVEELRSMYMALRSMKNSGHCRDGQRLLVEDIVPGVQRVSCVSFYNGDNAKPLVFTV